MSGRQRASRREVRLTTRRRIRLRRTTTVAMSAALVFGLLGVLGALPLPEGAGEPSAEALPRLTDDRREPAPLELAVPVRPSAPATLPVATPMPAATPAPDVKPLATAPLPAASGTGKRIVYGITAQQVWLVDAANSVTRTYLVSGSRYDQLDPGAYAVFSRSETATSWHGTETMEYMVRFHRGTMSNIGFHDIPVATATGAEVQALADLGTPLSDGCIRQDVVDAQALWDFAPVGTAVVVLA